MNWLIVFFWVFLSCGWYYFSVWGNNYGLGVKFNYNIIRKRKYDDGIRGGEDYFFCMFKESWKM